MNAKLGDFELARLHDRGSNPGTTRVVGTLGYFAPELTRTGKATVGSDVYAFGALLLEVVCGRRPMEPKAALEELVLVDLVWEWVRDERIGGIVDHRLNGDNNEKEAATVLTLGIMCSSNMAAAGGATLY
ncbi:unnamed protein product [Linum tenue]|uniref:Protein kinase domain-containing protein n=1 Tax=Linum tenue TaxID=586396 RepID=A0AAV0KZM1_9ROSI|nr:unnamed protein product [Linum tenue]